MHAQDIVHQRGMLMMEEKKRRKIFTKYGGEGRL